MRVQAAQCQIRQGQERLLCRCRLNRLMPRRPLAYWPDESNRANLRPACRVRHHAHRHWQKLSTLRWYHRPARLSVPPATRCGRAVPTYPPPVPASVHQPSWRRPDQEVIRRHAPTLQPRGQSSPALPAARQWFLFGKLWQDGRSANPLVHGANHNADIATGWSPALYEFRLWRK